MSGRGGQRLKLAYQTAFEESFVDNYDEWKSALKSMNASIRAINKASGTQYRSYGYDEFCCLAKLIIDETMQKLDWDRMVEEEHKKRKGVTSAAYTRGSKKRAAGNFRKMELDILHLCFETAMKKCIGAKTYKKFQKQIEQRKEVVL